MPQRPTDDGGHTAFTDHWIAARPGTRVEPDPSGRLAAWRDPPPEYRERNLALALLSAGARDASPALIERSYAPLLRATEKFPDDSALLTGIGTALQSRGETESAAKVFERVISLRPNDALAEENAGMAWLDAGDREAASRHLERALAMDPLLLPDIDALRKIYSESGDQAREAALMRKVQQAMRTGRRSGNPGKPVQVP